MIDLSTATGHIHYSESARLNLKTFALTYQNNIHGYISNLLKRLVIQYVLAVAVGPVYGLILLHSRSLCYTLMHTMYPCTELHNAMSELTRNANKTSEQYRELEVARITRDVKDLHTYRKLSISRKSRAYVYLHGSYCSTTFWYQLW